MTKHLALIYILVGLLSLRGCPSAEGTRGSVGLGIKCGEVTVTITAKRRFFEENRVPFKPEHLRLGTESANCKPTAQVSDSEIIISVGLQECGADFYVRDEWLVYFNQLVLLPAVVPTATGTMIVRGTGTSIPVECHYRSKQTVSGEPLTPTWRPMTSTIRSSGLLHFTLRTMQDGCTSPRSSSVYQQGEAVFLEASVQAPLHPPLTIYVDYCVATLKPDPLSLPSYKFVAKHGCLMDSVLPDSSSKFLSRHHDNRLCFSVQAFRFNQKFEETVFITCHLKATLKNTLKSYHNKACFFHKPTFSWRSTEGDGALCDCCDTDCFRHIENKNDTGYTTEIEQKQKVVSTVGPLRTTQHFRWTGLLSVTRENYSNIKN